MGPTDMTRDFGAGPVRGVVTLEAMIELEGELPDFAAAVHGCSRGNSKPVRLVLAAVLRASGVPQAQINPEIKRIVEDGGLLHCGAFCADLLQHAFMKDREIVEAFPQAEAAPASPSADAT